MTYLSSNQLKQYEDQGYISPIEVLSSSEALEAREEIELIEKKMPNEIDKSGRYNVHLISPKLDSIVHNSKILDAVESIIGKNILVCSTTLFIKNPNEQGFVSYHQDAKYIGLEPHNWVTAWVALTDSNENNGCMKMWPKSHLNIKDHNEKFNKGNLLTRGQTVENVPEDEVKSIELRAGQMLDLRFPLRKSEGDDQDKTTYGTESDDDVSGKYLISELKHTLGNNEGTTQLKLIRDVFTA